MYSDVRLPSAFDLDIQLGKSFKLRDETFYGIQGTSVTVITCGCGTATCYGRETCASQCVQCTTE